MTNTTRPHAHPLIGTWITQAEDSNVKWDGKTLSFTAKMPSTGTITKNVFRMRQDGRLDLELTTYEVWKKTRVKPGQMPEAWRSMPLTKARPGSSSK